MLAKFTLTLVLVTFLISCGQDGRLYLSDEDKIKRLNKRGANPVLIQQIKEREQKERVLRDLAKQQKKELKSLGGKKSSAVFKAKELEYLETQYEIGQIILKRQQEGN